MMDLCRIEENNGGYEFVLTVEIDTSVFYSVTSVKCDINFCSCNTFNF